MSTGDGSDLVLLVAQEVAKNVPVKEVYQDGISPGMKEVGGLLADTIKCLRLLALPIQAGALLQDRWIRFVDKSKSAVDPEKLVLPAPQILGPILEAVKYEVEGSISDKAFSELLSRAFDRERAGQAHPAFPAIIRALADDEMELLRRARKGVVNVKIGYHSNGIQTLISDDEDRSEFSYLTFPKQVMAYANHLEALGLLNDLIGQAPTDEDYGNAAGRDLVWRLTISDFGKLFASAVIS